MPPSGNRGSCVCPSVPLCSARGRHWLAYAYNGDSSASHNALPAASGVEGRHRGGAATIGYPTVRQAETATLRRIELIGGSLAQGFTSDRSAEAQYAASAEDKR